MLLSRIAVVILPLLLSPFSPIASAQEDAVATCPQDTVSEGALTLPNGDACKLCVPSMDDCKASCSCPTADTCECTPDPPGCGTLVCPGDEPPPDQDCDACEAPDMPGTFYCVGDTFLVDEGSDSCASCTCDDADGAIGCVSCNPPSVEMPDEDETKEEDTVSTSEECSVTVNVGCVLMDDESMDCNEYIPTSPDNCDKQVKFTLQIDQQAPPLNIMLESIYRYRETSAFGNPRSYSEDKWGTNLTPFEMQYYKLNTWEGEYVNFCVPTSIETTLEYKTSCATTSDTYVLETTDVFPEQTVPFSAVTPTPEDGEVNVDFLVGDDTTSDAAAFKASFLLASAGALVMMFW